MATLPSFADVEELADWLGETIETQDERRAQGVLRMASALVRTETRRDWVDEHGVPEDPLPEVLQLVTLQVAARAFTNPKGVTSANESIDDFITGERYKVEEAGMYLTASERGLLEPLAGRRHGGLGTVSRSRGESAPFGLRGDGSDERILPPYY